jgi:hypothetical protein
MAGGAEAAPENAATVTKSSGCRDFLQGVICSESMWVVKDTQTPSGNFLTTANGNTAFTYTGSDGCTWSSTQKKREHWTVQPDGIQGAHVLQTSETTNTCFGYSVVCTDTVHFQFVNGSSRIYKSEFECTPL